MDLMFSRRTKRQRAFSACVGRRLRGRHFRTKRAQKRALKAAISACKRKMR